MNNTISTTSNNDAYKSLLYWRKNLWNGSDCVPIILVLEDNILTVKDADGANVFSTPLHDVVVNFTGWGTMTLTVSGKKYDIVGMPAATSPQISELQKAELSGLTPNETGQHTSDTQPIALGGAVASATGNAGATVIGAAASTAVYYKGLGTIREWKTLIGSAADQKHRFNNMTYFIIAVVVILIVAITLK